MPSTTGKAANLSLDNWLVSETRKLDINPSRAAGKGIAWALKADRKKRGLQEHAGAIRACDDDSEKNGLPLEENRIV